MLAMTKLGLITTIYLAISLPAGAYETIARAAMVFDQTSNTVLLTKNETMPLPPASMSKLMTLNMLFEALQDGRITLDTQFTVSAKASKKGGSKMFLRDGERVSVENLIRGIIVHSGNDACIVVAENLAGSEADFARIMTSRALKLGMKNSTFANATGWPDPNQRMSAADLVLLASRIITDFPEFYGYFQEESFIWADITQENRNPLIKLGLGVDGLKTGHTTEAGYGLVASARQGNRRVILMITGLESADARAREGERLMNWAFRQFSEKTLIEAEKKIVEAPIWFGQRDSVGLETAKDVVALVPYESKDDVKLKVTYDSPLQAPISKGQEVGFLTVEIPGLKPTRYPVVASQSVATGGLLKRLKISVQVLTGSIGAPAEATK
ncbi:MAG: D-alanyl-D-alanine carboxypeptidase [Rhodobacteraceae bacterium]|nr:D-alanyl-D-alanine carboxypeptidase [Paracoccaceae bacterium]